MRTLALALLLLSCATTPVAPEPQRCNGHAELCARRYNEVAYPTTHNAFSNEEEGFILSNQRRSIEQQLDDGVRAMMLDVYEFEGAPYLCHTGCELGRRSLDDALSAIGAFLEAHPGEVLTFQFESYTTGTSVAASFERSGLIRYVYTHPKNAPWPTLGDLVQADTRVVSFYETNSPLAGVGAPDWYQPLFENSFDTYFKAAKPEDFTCNVRRGVPGAPLFTLNHFLTNLHGFPDLAEQVNHDPFLIDRARRCQQARGHIPNFVAVDYYDIGDLFEAVRELNGL